jgi:predicted exporter
LSESNSFGRVANGANELDETAIRFLFENRYLLGPDIGQNDFTSEGMKRAIAAALGQMGSLSGYALSDLLPADPTGRAQALIAAWRGTSQPHYKHGVWFSQDETMALILAATVANGDDQIGQTQAQADIAASFASIADASGAQLVMTGTP